MRLAAAALALLLTLGGAAQAAGSFDLYRQGKYEEAVRAGEAEHNARGLSVAARAVLADAMLRDKPCLPCLRRAETFARAAIAADARVPEGHIYLAVALGYQGRIEGGIVAKLKGYPEEARRELDAALEADPGNVWALAALAGWHVEIVRKGGARLAWWIYGASLEEGLAKFAEVFKRAPNHVALQYQYAVSLGGFDARTYRSRVAAALERCIKGNAASAYDRFIQARAAEMLAALKANDGPKFAVLVRRAQGYR